MIVLVVAGSNVASYINMVCDQLRNSLPKAAVHCQVREAKRSLLDHFYAEVGKREVTILFTLSPLMTNFTYPTNCRLPLFIRQAYFEAYHFDTPSVKLALLTVPCTFSGKATVSHAR